MTPSAQLQAVITLCDLVLTARQPADALLASFFRNRRFIGSKDRAAIAGTVYAVFRAWHHIDWWLAKTRGPQTGRARMIIFLRLAQEMTSDHVQALFSGGAYAPGPLSEEERALLRQLAGGHFDHPGQDLRTRSECPEWAFAPLQKALGKQYANEMSALLDEAQVDLRVNILKTSREAVLAELHKEGIAAEAGTFCPWAIRLAGRQPLSGLGLFKSGHIEIQDEGSQLIALLLGAKPGEKVVDFCAGAGGKTLAIAAMMKSKGRLFACDVLAGRLKRAAVRFNRAGLTNITPQPLANERDAWVKRQAGTFDRLLVDAPCTGTGTWRRNPDARFRQLGPGLETLLPLQAEILDSAQRLVKPGGRLVYATCSVLPEENEEQIEKFLTAHTDFRLVPLSEGWAEVAAGKPPGAGPHLKLSPAKHGTDGFFAAILERAA